MKRMRVVWCALAMVFITAYPASAHHLDGTDMFPDGGHNRADTWVNSGTETYCIAPAYFAAFSDAAVDNIRNAANSGLNKWENVSDYNKVFTNNIADPDGECGAEVNIFATLAAADVTKSFGENKYEEFCQEYVTSGWTSRLEYENVDSGSYGQTITCDVNNDEFIDWFTIIMDVDSEWYFPMQAPNANFPLSYWAGVTHEGGHVGGWGGGDLHWPNDPQTCPDTAAGHNTMCDDGWGFRYGLGGTANVSPETHDIGEFNQAY